MMWSELVKGSICLILEDAGLFMYGDTWQIFPHVAMGEMTEQGVGEEQDLSKR
jgi:hypothetical protein